MAETAINEEKFNIVKKFYISSNKKLDRVNKIKEKHKLNLQRNVHV
jgi:hypothetical protein